MREVDFFNGAEAVSAEKTIEPRGRNIANLNVKCAIVSCAQRSDANTIAEMCGVGFSACKAGKRIGHIQRKHNIIKWREGE